MSSPVNFSIKSIETIRSRLVPFSYHKFRVFFVAQGVSLVGSWMQELTKSLLVMHIIDRTGAMGKTAAMGFLLAAPAIPNVLLGPAGGVLADKKGFRSILVITQVLLALTAFLLGVLVSTGTIEYWHLVVFALCEGCILAFDMPAFQMVTPQLVPREHFQQALALNTSNFHLARVLGPSLAGIIVGFFGRASVFWLNAVSFVLVAIVLARMNFSSDKHHAPVNKAGQGSMKEALLYLKNHPVFLRIFAQFLLVQALVFPLIFTTLRVLIQDRFQLNDRDFGLVFSTPGLGALFGSLMFVVLNPKNPIRVMPFGVAGTVISLFAIAESFKLSLIVLSMMLFSICLFLTLSSLLVTVQLKVDDKFRGRISALVGMAFASVSPVMAYPMGLISDLMGGRHAIWLAASLFAAGSAFLAISNAQNREGKAN